jgi:PAS domain S-box-containing protein
MKISHKLISGYLAIALLMSFTGYLSIRIYNDIKYKVIQLNKYSAVEPGSSDEILLAIERCQTSTHDLFKKKYKIIYKPYETKPEEIEIVQAQQNLKANVDKLAHLLSGTKDSTRTPVHLAKEKGLQEIEEEPQEWLNLRKKRYFYQWKYISHFIYLAKEAPDQAYDFFERTLEPHYRKSIAPIIHQYREDAQEQMKEQFKGIVEEYIPSANIIIIVSTLVLLFSVVLLGFWVSRSVSRPIIKLANAARDIGKGQLDTKIDIKSGDEIGILANAFNQMTYDLSRTTVSKSYVDNIIKSMLDTLIVVDADATIAKVNKSTLDLLGYKENELIGKPIEKVIIEEGSKTGSVFDGLIPEGSAGNVEKTYLTKDGAKIPVLFSGAVMPGDNGKIQGIVCVAQDISSRKHAEIALQKAHEELERRVEMRTAELVEANKQLKNEIAERMRTEEALRESRNRLQFLSSHILNAQEEERRRLSLELHDELGQSLSLLKIQLGSIKRQLREDQASLMEPFEQTRQYLNLVIENVRRLSRDLSPSILEDLGLSAGIEWLIRDFAKHYNFRASFDTEDISDLFSPEHQIVIYRIFQEIFTNIGKHAQATHVSVAIQKQDWVVSFLVEDNGKGFDINEVSLKSPGEKGMGLAAMHERARMVGSSLDIWTQNGKGTKISFTIPTKRGERQ